MNHEIPLERRTLHGHFSRDLEPILTIESGDSIAFACPNASWRVTPEEKFEPRDDRLDAGHALIGPIEVREDRDVPVTHRDVPEHHGAPGAQRRQAHPDELGDRWPHAPVGDRRPRLPRPSVPCPTTPPDTTPG